MQNRFQFFQIFYIIKYYPLLLILFCGCNYDPNDEYFVDIDPSIQPVININLNNQDSVISMWQETKYVYNFSSTPGLTILSVDVYIDNELVVSSPSSHVEFIVSPSVYAEGQHLITITASTNSGTGSLADHLGAEESSFTKEWVLMISHDVPVACYLFMSEMINDNGLLKVSWDKYSGPEFQYYQLFSSPTVAEGEDFWFHPVTEITNSAQNYFYDSSYVGGLRSYHVRLRAYGALFGGDADMVDTVCYPYSTILSAHPEGYDLHIAFSKCLFPKAFKEYRLSVSPDEYNKDIVEIVIPDLDDTTITLHNLPFGKNFTLKLATYPVNIEYDQFNNNYQPTSKFVSHIGDNSFAFGIIDALPSGDAYFTEGFDGGSIYRYSDGNVTEILHITDELSFNNSFHVSESGNYFAYRDAINHKISLYTLPDMVKISETGDINIARSSRISNNGLVPVWTPFELMIYDFLQDKIIDTLYTNYSGIYQVGTYFGSESFISPDGEYLYVNIPSYAYGDTIYHRTENNNYVSIGTTNTFAVFMGFNPLSNSQIIYYGNDLQPSIQIFDYSTMSTVRTITGLKEPFSNVDPVTGNILSMENPEENIFGLYSLADGSKLGSVRIGNNVSIESMKLINSVLYTADGAKMRIVP